MRAFVGEEVSCCDAPQDAEADGEVSIDSSTLSISLLLGRDLVGCFEVSPVVGMMSGSSKISECWR